MKKLNDTVAAFAPFHPSAFVATAPLRQVVHQVPRLTLSRAPLRCAWREDGAGHLICCWSEASAA